MIQSNRTEENSGSNGTERSEPMRDKINSFIKYFRANRDEIIKELLVGVILIIIDKILG